jgi:hypothetical protein
MTTELRSYLSANLGFFLQIDHEPPHCTFTYDATLLSILLFVMKG